MYTMYIYDNQNNLQQVIGSLRSYRCHANHYLDEGFQVVVKDQNMNTVFTTTYAH